MGLSTRLRMIHEERTSMDLRDILRFTKLILYKLVRLARTEKGNLKQIQYNPTWNYFKNLVKDELTSKEGARIYAKRKVDVEPVFGRMKGVFGVRRVHVRGQKVVETEIGFLLMSMNLTKLTKKLVQDSRNKKKSTDSSAEFYQNQLNLSVYFLVIG